jgi:hypothetical protein
MKNKFYLYKYIHFCTSGPLVWKRVVLQYQWSLCSKFRGMIELKLSGTILYRWTTPLLHGNHCLQMDDTVITWEPLSTDGRHRYYMGTIVYRWTAPLLHGNHCLQMDDTVITWEPLSTDGRHHYCMGTIVYRWTTPLLHGNHCLQKDDTVITIAKHVWSY